LACRQRPELPQTRSYSIISVPLWRRDAARKE
jgi:hypothetical protein